MRQKLVETGKGKVEESSPETTIPSKHIKSWYEIYLQEDLYKNLQ